MAPSPTGFFHLGSARTALYNWLFARHNQGKFILRVEDTDVQRSSKEMIQTILDGLGWLGLNWDEGPYFQSERLAIYKKYVQQLIDKGYAYYCYCRPEDLAREREAALKNKQSWKYDRRCLNLTPEQKKEKERANHPKAVRFLVPDHPVVFYDLIHKEIKRDFADIEDFIILRQNGIPTYNLACAVDDYEMGITHVIRAVEHITNTPKQILLYEALNFSKPEFAHLPLILGEDRKKLSKRHGAVSLMAYKEKGFIPEAMVNFLALLGWSPGNDKEIMSIKEIIQRFSLKRINPANAIFDIQKLEWMNGQYIYRMSDGELLESLKPFLIKFKFITPAELDKKREWILRVCGAIKKRLKVLADIDKAGRYFFVEDFEYEPRALEKHLHKETIEIVKEFSRIMETITDFDGAHIEESLRGFVKEKNIPARNLIHPLRVFTTGKEGGPGLFLTLELIGKERCLKRIKKIIKNYEEKNG